MKKAAKHIGKIIKVLLISLIFGILIGSIMLFSVYFSANIDENKLKVKKSEIEVFCNENKLINNDNLYKYVRYEDISPNIINAFVALEDKRFFSHNGIDLYRICGALINNVKHGYFKEGGSTITQQLAKNTHLTNDKTFKRKIQELRMARLIEKKYSKEEILEMYLNAIYYGSGIYGIDSACKNYFNKHPNEVSISEGAILAGIVKNPQKYSPKNNPKNAISRRNLVLSLMCDQGYISKDQFMVEKSKSYLNNQQKQANSTCVPYYNAVLAEACEILNVDEKSLINSNYKIHTYYNHQQQTLLTELFSSNNFSGTNKNNVSPAYSATICDNATGSINAYYSNSELNVITTRRQPASTIKPFIAYCPALENGLITTETMVFDEKIDYNGYSPKNYGNSYDGWITIENALKSSKNSIPVKLFNELGINNAIAFAKGCGFKFNDNDYNLSTALGGMTYGTTIPELTSAYMTLANGGIYRKNTFIRQIIDENGKIVYKNDNKPIRVMSPDTAYLTTNMLIETVKNGTAKKLNGFEYQIAAKTGTSQSAISDGNLDAWNISYNTQNTVCVWYGDVINDGISSLDITGGSLPTLLANKIYKSLNPPQKSSFSQPYSVIELEIDSYAQNTDKNLYLTNAYTPQEYRKKCFFSTKNHPTEVSNYFDLSKIECKIDTDYESGALTINLSNSPIYTYILIEKDILNSVTTNYNLSNSQNLVSLPKENGVYSYAVEVRFNNKRLGYIASKLIFI